MQAGQEYRETVEIVRIDSTSDSLTYWQENDGPGGCGITEIRQIEWLSKM